jgi:hypothetical protein
MFRQQFPLIIKNKEQKTKSKKQRAKNKEQKTKSKKQRAKNKEQKTKSKKKRSENVATEIDPASTLVNSLPRPSSKMLTLPMGRIISLQSNRAWQSLPRAHRRENHGFSFAPSP